MRLVLRLHRVPGMDAAVPAAAEVLRTAPEHGAATTPFAGRIGTPEPGMAADLGLLDWHRIAHPCLDAGTSVLDAVVHRGRAAGVAAVLGGGKAILWDAGFCSSRGPCGLGRARLDHQERT